MANELEIIEANAATLQHIRRVQELLNEVVRNLLHRSRIHDEWGGCGCALAS